MLHLATLERCFHQSASLLGFPARKRATPPFRRLSPTPARGVLHVIFRDAAPRRLDPHERRGDTMDRTAARPGHKRPLSAIAGALALRTFAPAPHGQTEVAGQAAATGAPVPKSVSVAQGRLDGAARDGSNFLHSNANYANTRY